MRVTKTIKPGHPGSQRYLERYGDRLVCVRYRQHPDTPNILTTVELIIDQRERLPNNVLITRKNRNKLVAVKIGYEETELRNQAKALGAKWSQSKKVWVMLYPIADKLELLDRVIPNLATRVTDVDIRGHI